MTKQLLTVFKVILTCFMLQAIFLSCKQDDPFTPVPTLARDYDHEVSAKWNVLLLEVERFTPGYLPPVAGRAYGYIGLAAYETVVPGMPENKSLGNHFYDLHLPVRPNGEIHYPTALNSAYATIVMKFFHTAPAAQLSEIISLQNIFNQQFISEVSPEVFEASVEWGEDVAEAIFAWSTTDVVGHEGYLRPSDPNYLPPAGPGLWQPTYPDYRPALLPHWGDVRTFAASSDDKCKDPLPYSDHPSSEFYVQALETENKVNLIKQ